MDTIAAPITAPGHAAVSVLRISGSRTRDAVRAVVRRAKEVLSSPRLLVFSEILDGGETIDHGLVAFFATPASFTGEDCAEFQLHGSPYLVCRLLEALARHGVRAARPGEFTERAFLNGKLDLSQAEAVADLVHAESEAQARVAREQLEGKLSRAVGDLGAPLRELVAEIEAHIDFPDEDINPLSYAEWSRVIAGVRDTCRSYVESFRTGKLCREGASVVLVGLPNAGKSSLMNRLVGEDRVIVTDIPGTTRDAVEERISLGGLLVRLCDTAGLEYAERAPDEVERLGIERSWRRAEGADLVLYVVDATRDFSAERAIFERVRAVSQQILVLSNKCDLGGGAIEGALLVSAETGAGLSELRDAVIERLVGRQQGGGLLVTSERHADALRRAEQSLTEALRALERKDPAEFISLLLRSALTALEEIVGVTTTEEIFGLIFSKFCIGK